MALYMTTHRCAVCGSKEIDVIKSQTQQPLYHCRTCGVSIPCAHCPRLFFHLVCENNKRDILSNVSFIVLALPIFPGRCQPSIVGRSELNFRVRDGNGWTLALISTNCWDAIAPSKPNNVRWRKK